MMLLGLLLRTWRASQAGHTPAAARLARERRWGTGWVLAQEGGPVGRIQAVTRRTRLPPWRWAVCAREDRTAWLKALTGERLQRNPSTLKRHCPAP